MIFSQYFKRMTDRAEEERQCFGWIAGMFDPRLGSCMFLLWLPPAVGRGSFVCDVFRGGHTYYLAL